MELASTIRDGEIREVAKEVKVPAKLRQVILQGLAARPEARWPSMDALLTELRKLVAPRTGRWTAVGLAGGLGALGGGLALGQYAEVMDRCTGARVQLEGIWDEGRKQEVKAAILGTELVYAPGTWERVEQRLDGYAEAWAGKHTEVCEATRVTEEQSEETMELRMGCLRERRTALRAAVKVLSGADNEVVEEAVGLVAGLPMLERCDDVELLEQQRQRVPPPEEPVVAQEVERLRERLADIEAEAEAGKYAQALQQVEPLVQRADALGYAPLLAEVKLRRGWLLGESGKYAEAEQELKAAHTLALKHEHDDVVLNSAQGLTSAVGNRQARHAEGIIWGQMALPLAERGGKDVELARSLYNLGTIFRKQGEYEQAKLHHQRALQIMEKALGADHPSVATSLDGLGNVFGEQGEYEQAKLHYQRALQIREKALGPNHPDVAGSFNNLGNVFEKQGGYEQAKLHFQRALQKGEKALGPNHPRVAGSFNNLGNVFRDQGEYEQAKLHYQRALQIWEKVLGPDHPSVAMSLDNLGNVFLAQGEYVQAKLHHQRALQIKEKSLGPDHPSVAISLNNLGNVFLVQGEYVQAKLHLQRALQIWEKALGSDHPDMAMSLINLGAVFRAQGEYEQAKLHFQRALQIAEKALGPDHSDLAYSLVGLAEVALAQEQFDSARAHAQRALSIREAGEIAPELLAEARFLLARALWADRPQRARARELTEQARDAFAKQGKGGEDDLAETETWLAERRLP